MAESYTTKDILALGLVVARLVERLDEVRAERDAVIAALVAEYADVLARRGTWRRDRIPEAEMERAVGALGAERALHKVALRLGLAWDELRERAARADQAVEGGARDGEESS